MKLNDILSENFQSAEWEAKGYELPKYDIDAVAKKTHDEPTWVDRKSVGRERVC